MPFINQIRAAVLLADDNHPIRCPSEVIELPRLGQVTMGSVAFTVLL